MPARNVIFERWFARVAETYSGETATFLTGEKDPFRNPVGYTLAENLRALVGELLGEMDEGAVSGALENILRIRAVQDLTATQAVGFIFLVRPIIRELMSTAEAARLDGRIDQLALLAFNEYTRCREQLAQLRAGEERRASHFASARQRRQER